MLTDECCHLLVCHVIFCLDFFAGVPFCQFWSGIFLDKVLVYTCFRQTFFIPYSIDVYVLSLGKGSWGTLAKDWSAPKGKAWMLIPTSFHNSLPTPAATRGGNREITEQVAEVICLEVSGIGDLDDSDVTGISRIAVEDGNDTWYNLSGQRISTPTKKGLYIKNGKKVIVK